MKDNNIEFLMKEMKECVMKGTPHEFIEYWYDLYEVLKEKGLV